MGFTLLACPLQPEARRQERKVKVGNMELIMASRATEEPPKGKLLYVTLRMHDETKRKLDELAKRKYRGVNRGLALRWLIEDSYQLFQERTEELKGL
jgi:hypothetical protein